MIRNKRDLATKLFNNEVVMTSQISKSLTKVISTWVKNNEVYIENQIIKLKQS